MKSKTAGTREEFARNRLGSLVTVIHRDVCADGFGDELRAKADAVMLDLPSPWLAVSHAWNALKPQAMLASYSPCIEQSQRVCKALSSKGFHSKWLTKRDHGRPSSPNCLCSDPDCGGALENVRSCASRTRGPSGTRCLFLSRTNSSSR